MAPKRQSTVLRVSVQFYEIYITSGRYALSLECKLLTLECEWDVTLIHGPSTPLESLEVSSLGGPLALNSSTSYRLSSEFDL